MKKILIALVCVALGAGAFWGWQRFQQQEAVRIMASEAVTIGSVRKVLEQTGIIKAQVGAIVKIGARASGAIEQMLVKVGDQVEKGQLVARIDSRELAAQEDEARAKERAARAELTRIRTTYPLRIAEAEAQLALSETQADYLAKSYERHLALAGQAAIAQDTLDESRQKAKVEESRVESLAAVLARTRAEFVEEAKKAELAQAQAAASLASIRIRRSYTEIQSPMTGVVSQVTAQEGETVITGLQVANLITVLDPSRLEMWVYVDETDVGQVRPGQKAEFRVEAYPGKIFTGEILTIYPQPEIRDNIVYYQALVRVTPEQAELLRPDMTTQVQIIVAEKEDVLQIPNAALKWVDGRQIIFVQDKDGAVRQLTPRLGLTGLTHSEVLEGVGEGSLVATQVLLPKQQAMTQGAPPAQNTGTKR